MIRAGISPRAERDLDRITGRIAIDNPEAAERVREVFLETDLLSGNAGLGISIPNASARHATTRWFVIPQFRNYLIFYRPFKESIVVVRILHAAQDWTRFFGK